MMLKKITLAPLASLAFCAALWLTPNASLHAASLAECDYDENKIAIACPHWSIRIRGRFHLDTLFDAVDDSNPQFVKGATGIAFRRARLGFSGKIRKDFAFKSVVDFSGNDVSVKSFYLDYRGMKNVVLRAGHQNPPFGLLVLSSSNDIHFMARVLNKENRFYGVSAFYRFKGGQFGLGIHGDSMSNSETALAAERDTDFGAAARLTFAPVLRDDMFLHIGGGVRYMKNRRGADIVYETRAPFTKAVFDSKLYSIKAKDADSRIDFSPEFAFGYKSFGAQGEFLFSQVGYKGSAARGDDDVLGFYLQAHYWLTGEQNGYDVKAGEIKGVSPHKGVHAGGWGAFGVALRWNQMFFGDYDRGTFRALTANMTWVPMRNIRVMTEWAQVWRSAALCGCDSKDKPYVAQMRLQFTF